MYEVLARVRQSFPLHLSLPCAWYTHFQPASAYRSVTYTLRIYICVFSDANKVEKWLTNFYDRYNRSLVTPELPIRFLLYFAPSYGCSTNILEVQNIATMFQVVFPQSVVTPAPQTFLRANRSPTLALHYGCSNHRKVCQLCSKNCSKNILKPETNSPTKFCAWFVDLSFI